LTRRTGAVHLTGDNMDGAPGDAWRGGSMVAIVIWE
jgi:hypothetical protein